MQNIKWPCPKPSRKVISSMSQTFRISGTALLTELGNLPEFVIVLDKNKSWFNSKQLLSSNCKLVNIGLAAATRLEVPTYRRNHDLMWCSSETRVNLIFRGGLDVDKDLQIVLVIMGIKKNKNKKILVFVLKHWFRSSCVFCLGNWHHEHPMFRW